MIVIVVVVVVVVVAAAAAAAQEQAVFHNALDRQTDRPTDRSFTGKFDNYRLLRYESDAA